MGQGAALGLCNSNYLGDGPTRSIGLPGALRALRASGPTPLSVPHVGNGQRDITPIRPVTPHRFVYLPPMNSAASSIPLKVHLRAAGVENGPPIGRSRRRCRQAAAEWCRPRSGRSRHRISPPQTGRSVRSLRSSRHRQRDALCHAAGRRAELPALGPGSIWGLGDYVSYG